MGELVGSNTTKIAYKNSSDVIEKVCKWFCIIALFTAAFCNLSVLIFTIVNYFILNLAEKSYYLIFPTMYV